MAKAKKQESESNEDSGKKPGAKRPAAKGGGAKKTAKAGKSAAAPAAPMIDTSLAAEAAARMIGNRGGLGSAAPSLAPNSEENESAGAEPPRQESSTFKQLKESLSKTSSARIGNLLGTPSGQKKSGLPFSSGKQNFRNQTFGADVNRTGVPRRTGG